MEAIVLHVLVLVDALVPNRRHFALVRGKLAKPMVLLPITLVVDLVLDAAHRRILPDL